VPRGQLTVLRVQLPPSWSLDERTQARGLHAGTYLAIRRTKRGRDAQYCAKLPRGLFAQEGIRIENREYLRPGTRHENFTQSP
jgi:hypothetical protein